MSLTFGAGATGAGSSLYTFPTHAIGAAASDRYVIVGVAHTANGGTVVNSVTVNGAATTRVAFLSGTGGSASIYITNAPVATGATASIAVTLSGVGGIVIASYALYAPSSTTPSDTKSTATDNASLGLSVPTGGVGIGFATGQFSTYTVANGTEDYDATQGNGLTGCAAHTTTTGTVALRFDASSLHSAAVAASWAITSAVDLDADGIVTGAPTVADATLGQVHVLAADGLAAGPALDSPTLGVVYPLAATGIKAGAPAVDQPAFGQVHDLAGLGIDAGVPTLGTPSTAVSDSLSATGIATGAPTVGSPAASEAHVLSATVLETGAPTLGAPALGSGAIVEPPTRPVLPIASGGWVGGGERGTTAIYGPYERRKPKTTRELVREALSEAETPPKPPEPPRMSTRDRAEMVRAMLAAENVLARIAEDEDDDDLLLMAA